MIIVGLSVRLVLIIFYSRLLLVIRVLPFIIRQFEYRCAFYAYTHIYIFLRNIQYLFLQWHTANLCSRRSHELNFPKREHVSGCHFTFEELKWLSCINNLQRKSDFTVTSRRFTLGNKEMWKKGLWSQLRGILEQKPSLNDLSFLPALKQRNAVSPLPLFELRWWSTWGGQHHARQLALKRLSSY